MRCRFQAYVDKLDELTRDYFKKKLNSWGSDKLAKANELASKLDKAGCIEPEAWVFSEISEDIPQSARFTFLKHLWDQVVSPASKRGVENLRLSNVECAASLKKIDAVLSIEEKDQLFREFAIQMGWDFSQVVNDGVNEEQSQLPSWVLMEVDSGSGELTGREIHSLHESYMDKDFSG